jgi:hypothetical protein
MQQNKEKSSVILKIREEAANALDSLVSPVEANKKPEEKILVIIPLPVMRYLQSIKEQGIKIDKSLTIPVYAMRDPPDPERKPIDFSQGIPKNSRILIF